MIFASKSTLNLNNLKIFRHKVTKNLTNLTKKFCEFPARFLKTGEREKKIERVWEWYNER